MRITTLMENKTERDDLRASHGLSLFVEFKGKKILFDIGQNKGFLKNAGRLGIDLDDVDYVIISHGHYDHGKKLNHFLKRNHKAKVYLSEHAYDNHTVRVAKLFKDIGIKRVKDKTRVEFVKGKVNLFDDLFLTDGVSFKQEVLSDERLYVKKEGVMVQDNFEHEIYAVFKEKDQYILLTGCSHKGIRNITDTLQKEHDIHFDYVIGGYHLMRYDTKNQDHVNYIEELGNSFKRVNTKFYACHCTGDDAFNHLDHIMSNLYPLHVGDVIDI